MPAPPPMIGSPRVVTIRMIVAQPTPSADATAPKTSASARNAANTALGGAPNASTIEISRLRSASDMDIVL